MSLWDIIDFLQKQNKDSCEHRNQLNHLEEKLESNGEDSEVPEEEPELVLITILMNSFGPSIGRTVTSTLS